VAALLGAAAAAAYLAVRGQHPSTVAPSTTPLRLVAATDYDPLGDNIENPTHVGLAIDHNPLTAWSTETYLQRNLGGTKPGVGIYVTLAEPARIRLVSVDTFETDWNGQIYAAPARPPQFAGWGKPLATRDHLQKHTDFRVQSTDRVRVVLLWITYLPPSGQLNVAEVSVR
jgi:hypothetical protein